MKRDKERHTLRTQRARNGAPSVPLSELSETERRTRATLRSALRTSSIVRVWRRSGDDTDKTNRDWLAEATGRSIGTVRNWEHQLTPHEPRVSDVRAMEKAKPGLVRRLFPEAFDR